MTAALPLCRHCDQVISDPDDAVCVGYEPGNSGPGWEIRPTASTPARCS
ncbi:hypothetical protein ACWET9_42820 [Streptomyces sp. NPDC004059]